MNRMENNNHSKEQDWREDIRAESRREKRVRAEKEDEFPIDDLDIEEAEEEEEGMHGLLQRPYMTTVLLGVIVILLICIIVLLFLLPGREKTGTANGDLQQNITDYAQEQKQNDVVKNVSGEAVVVSIPDDDGEKQAVSDVSGQNSQSVRQPQKDDSMPASDAFVSADRDKTAVVVDIENEDNVAYTKEFILNEALPYFENNNQDAIWDLVHLKRYVKLSAELEGTNQFYYLGDVNSDGRPDGKGLAIYEHNSYYYGEWSDGRRNGAGSWFKYYIGQKDAYSAMGIYMAHSYSGNWSNDLPNGQGSEHYDVDVSRLEVRERILQNVIGSFSDGLYDGELYANTVDYTGNVEEWGGVATKGVFDLWRDMSAIGECSVWQKKDDPSICMDIDKSENRNQGLRELLKLEMK